MSKTTIKSKARAHEAALLENAIRHEINNRERYLELKGGIEDEIAKHMLIRWAAMVTAYEIAFSTEYFTRWP